MSKRVLLCGSLIFDKVVWSRAPPLTGFRAENPVNPVNYVSSLCLFTMFIHIVYFTGFLVPLGFAPLICCSRIVFFAEPLLRGGPSSNPVK